RERLGESLRGLRSPAAYAYEVYGDDLTLKAGSEPENELILRISAARLGQDQGRYYWRAKVYSRYEDGRWLAAQVETIPVYPLRPDLTLTDTLGRQAVEVGIEPRLPGLRTLYVLAQPVWVSRQTEFGVRRAGDQIQDVTTVSVPGVVKAGESYRLRAMHAAPSAGDLRAAVGPYPEWVTREYLQVPPEITDRTRALARRITEGQDNSFDKAQAVVRWLRGNIEYSRVTQEPPETPEPLDWFLFDYQTGFCEWYASAAVILLREAGVPARMAAGYAQGTPRQETGNLQELAESDVFYEVYGTDLHTWPEVYFPGYGWIEFEPTGGQPELARAGAEAGAAFGSRLSPPVPTPEAGLEQSMGGEEDLAEEAALPGGVPGLGGLRLALAVLTAAGGIALLLAAWLRADPVAWTLAVRGVSRGLRRVGVKAPDRLARLAPEDLTLSAVIYRRWSGWLPRLGLHPSPATTAHERAGQLAARHPALEEASRSLVEAYAGERYGAAAVDAKSLRRLWRGLELQMLLSWISGGVDK
ncbi:MAG: transglutaminase domain-containing protein, partial [Anaerolineales bacterium]|nr:transglutaminase domain-containing protein [Anaerolineales bacterium]